MTAGERLRAWRVVEDKNQREVADILGCSQATLTKLEADGVAPSVVLAVKIERLTGGAVPCEAWKKPEKKAAPKPTDESEAEPSASGTHGAVDPDKRDAASGA